MPWGGPNVQLPKEILLTAGAVPTSLTPVTSVDSEVSEITVTNTTAGSLTLTVQDQQGTPIKLLNAINVDTNVPIILPYDPPALMSGGIKWIASGAGLTGTIRGRQRMGLTQGAASATTNNQPTPA